ncbi:unnamed protein product [Microthlaspi erraticum]|uniref:ATP-dependent RNA helicase Ski2/MTR4 C-terminal domain-containing protein n=1 Tax=Microthlaspi erraticum TaxID=1685480 RepID=A0A6D2J8X8_9BRAS|nr:unnamed protein product [Microthlaspi erraticum]
MIQQSDLVNVKLVTTYKQIQKEYAQENLKFGDSIYRLTDVPEGLIVRTIVRLDETCREFKNAAAIMGNSIGVTQEKGLGFKCYKT